MEAWWCCELRIWWHHALKRPRYEVANTQQGFPDNWTNQAPKKSKLLSECACVSNPRHKRNPIYLDNLAALSQQTHSFWVTVDNMTERLKPDQILLARPHTQKKPASCSNEWIGFLQIHRAALIKPLITQMASKKNKSWALILWPHGHCRVGIHLYTEWTAVIPRVMCVIMCQRKSIWSEPHTYSK